MLDILVDELLVGGMNSRIRPWEEKKKLLVDPSFENFNCLQIFLQDSSTSIPSYVGNLYTTSANFASLDHVLPGKPQMTFPILNCIFNCKQLSRARRSNLTDNFPTKQKYSRPVSEVFKTSLRSIQDQSPLQNSKIMKTNCCWSISYQLSSWEYFL